MLHIHKHRQTQHNCFKYISLIISLWFQQEVTSCLTRKPWWPPGWRRWPGRLCAADSGCTSGSNLPSGRSRSYKRQDLASSADCCVYWVSCWEKHNNRSFCSLKTVVLQHSCVSWQNRERTKRKKRSNLTGNVLETYLSSLSLAPVAHLHCCLWYILLHFMNSMYAIFFHFHVNFYYSYSFRYS